MGRKGNHPMQNCKKPSWVAIFIMLIIFWPIGLFLLWKRIQNEGKLNSINSFALKSLGWPMAMIGLVGLAVSLDEGMDSMDSMDVAMILIFLGGGALLIYRGHYIKKQQLIAKKYLVLIQNQQITSLEELARATNHSYEKVCTELNHLISKGYIKGAVINYSLKRIIFEYDQAPVYRDPKTMQKAQKTAPVKAVTCKNCGATIMIAQGTTRKCEYCGSPITG